MFGSVRIGTMAGIPVKVHFTLVILLPFFVLRYASLLGVGAFGGAVTALGLFASVALHELGHALTGRRFACRTREILLTPLGGIAQLDRIPARPREEILIALAGPAVSLALAGLGFALHVLALHLRWPAGVGLVWLVLAITNIALGVFNLLPCFPMDGGRVFRALLTPRWGRLEATRRAVSLGGWFALALAIWGLYGGNLLTVAIAWFVHAAARSEYRAVQWQEAARQPSPLEILMRMAAGAPSPPPPPSPPEIVVGPPPYRR